jgi:hypothetical protein
VLIDGRLMFFARNPPQFYQSATLHSEGIRHTDFDADVRALKNVIYECQKSLEAINHTKLDF